MTDTLELRPSGQAKDINRIQRIAPQHPGIAISEKTRAAKSVFGPRQVYALVIYYMILLIGSVGCIGVLVWSVPDATLLFDASQSPVTTQPTPTPGATITSDQKIQQTSAQKATSTASLEPNQKRDKALISMAFLITGAIVGSVLYHIQTLFRFYIKDAFDPRWLGKYYSAPLESAALALADMYIVQGGAVFLGGSGIDFSAGKPFTVLGFGAVIGFGVREVVGWVGGVTKSMFPAPAVATAQPTSRRVVRRRPK
jgi:hypothetical protein